MAAIRSMRLVITDASRFGAMNTMKTDIRMDTGTAITSPITARSTEP